MTDRGRQLSTSDRKKLAALDRLEKERRRTELNQWRAVLTSRHGRAVLWSLMEYCKVLKEVWSPGDAIDSGIPVYYAAGQQNVGFHIMTEVAHADQDVFLTMMREAREQTRRDDAATEAVQMAAAGADALDHE
jgi:hypothetical protein